MEIRFERSGGFGGRATNVTGIVLLSDGAATVSSDPSGYERTLGAAEAADLQKLAVAALKVPPKSPTPGSADQFQYAVSIQDHDGRTRPATIDPQAGSIGDSAEPASLDSWVLREIDRIWQNKINKAKK